MFNFITANQHVKTKNKNMKHIHSPFLIAIIASFFFTACGNMSTDIENKLNELKSKTESLDSTINNEVDKVLTLDSLINTEQEKVKKLDSLINKNTSKLDSIASSKTKIIEQIIK